MHRFLAFDCGATSGRGILAGFDGESLSMEEVYRFPSEMKEVDGRMYWDVHAMCGHFVTCMKKLGAAGVKIDSIGIDTWGVDFGCIGKDGGIIGLPRCYRDPYTVGIPEKVYEKAKSRLKRRFQYKHYINSAKVMLDVMRNGEK